MSNVPVPEEFICPITMEIMVHPMATRYGHTYERSAIVAWIESGSSGECPLTRKPLKLTDVFPNHYLVVQIQAWREQNGLKEHSPSARQNNGREFMQELFEKIQNDFEAIVSPVEVEAAATSVSLDNARTLRLPIAALRRKQPNVVQAAASATRQRNSHRRSSIFTRRSR